MVVLTTINGCSKGGLPLCYTLISFKAADLYFSEADKPLSFYSLGPQDCKA